VARASKDSEIRRLRIRGRPRGTSRRGGLDVRAFRAGCIGAAPCGRREESRQREKGNEAAAAEPHCGGEATWAAANGQTGFRPENALHGGGAPSSALPGGEETREHSESASTDGQLRWRTSSLAHPRGPTLLPVSTAAGAGLELDRGEDGAPLVRQRGEHDTGDHDRGILSEEERPAGDVEDQAGGPQVRSMRSPGAGARSPAGCGRRSLNERGARQARQGRYARRDSNAGPSVPEVALRSLLLGEESHAAPARDSSTPLVSAGPPRATGTSTVGRSSGATEAYRRPRRGGRPATRSSGPATSRMARGG
jgi:hypothetical protein